MPAVSGRVRVCLFAVVVGVAATRLIGAAAPPPPPDHHQYIVVAKSPSVRDALRADALTAGGTLVREIEDLNALVVSGPASIRKRLAASAFQAGVAEDLIVEIAKPGKLQDLRNVSSGTSRGGVFGLAHPEKGDPAFALKDLFWNFKRIHAKQAWHDTMGSPSVTVGVADSGIDFGHSELAARFRGVRDFTDDTCKIETGFSDDDLALMFGGPADTDWVGNGTAVAGTIAASLDGAGMNGIAPKVGLVSLKITQFCGLTRHSSILAAIMYAATNRIDVVNLSLARYLDRTDPDNDKIYLYYQTAVKYAFLRGTTIVAAAGDEHIRIGRNGQVLSHGSITVPGFDMVDQHYGEYLVPGGVPGVVTVSAINNKVERPSPQCLPGTADDPALATCKPESDPHQSFGIGKKNQLAYYSNYGPRIDIAAPGGARKFNLPYYDRGGTVGYPFTIEDEFKAFGVFSTTSNWNMVTLLGPCVVLDGEMFSEGQCYTNMAGTAMAAPHVSATVALMVSDEPSLRRKPLAIVNQLLDTAKKLEHNTTPPLSATDGSPGDLTGLFCFNFYCHLGGRAIADNEAFGAGLVDADKALKKPHHEKHHAHDDHDKPGPKPHPLPPGPKPKPPKPPKTH